MKTHPLFKIVPLLALGLSAAPAARGEIKHVLHITVDGLRGDLLKNLVNTAPATYPNFKKLRDEGAVTFNARCDFDYSETIPNHSGVVTGRPVVDPPGQTGVAHKYTSNGYSGTATSGDSIHQLGTATYSYKFSTFDMAHDRGFSTAVYGGKARMNLYVHSYNATKGAADLILPDNGKNKVDFNSVADLTTTANLPNVKNAVIADITANTLRRYNLIHFTDTDTGQTGGGHNVGWGSTSWNVAVSTVDGYIGSILTAIAGNVNYAGKVAVVLTADHGGGGGGAGPGATSDRNHGDSSSIMNYTIPVMIWGSGIPAGVDAHTIFKNRADVGADRPNGATIYTQPLRNTDTANIAMALLGTPFVTGSYFKPEMQDTPRVTRSAGSVTISWPKYLTGYVPESSDRLDTAGSWTVESGTPTEAGADFQQTITVAPTVNRKFWRLRKPQ